MGVKIDSTENSMWKGRMRSMQKIEELKSALGVLARVRVEMGPNALEFFDHAVSGIEREIRDIQEYVDMVNMCLVTCM